ncbi:hypothetical protein NMG60_11005611 [Bertholletia excelsa]
MAIAAIAVVATIKNRMFGRHWSSRLSPFTPSPPGLRV